MLWPVYASVYDLIWDSPLTHQLAKAAVDACPGDGLVVDLGCGTGLIAREFVHRGREVVGVDNAPAMLRRAQRTGRVTSSVLASSDSTPIKSGSASAVLLCNVLHLHANPAAALSEAVRIARPGAFILITWPTDTVTNDQLTRLDLATGRGFTRSFTADQLRRMVALTASLLRVRRGSDADLLDAVASAVDQHPLVLVANATPSNVQRMLVLHARA